MHISRAKSLKLQAATLDLVHLAPLVKFPPQYRVAWSSPLLELPFPQGQLTTACLPIFASGQKRVIFRSCLPEDDGITVLLDGQPS